MPNKEKEGISIVQRKERTKQFLIEALQIMAAEEGVDISGLTDEIVVLSSSEDVFVFLEDIGIDLTRLERLKFKLSRLFQAAAVNEVAGKYLYLLPKVDRHSLRQYIHESKHIIDLYNEYEVTEEDTYQKERFIMNILFLLYIISSPLYIGVLPEFDFPIYVKGLPVVFTTLYILSYLHTVRVYKKSPLEERAREAEKRYADNKAMKAAFLRMKNDNKGENE